MQTTTKKPTASQLKVYTDTIQKLQRSQVLKNDVLKYLRNNERDFFKENAQRLKRIHECSNVITFRKRLETGDYQLVASNFCKYDRCCIACATKRAMIMIKKFSTGVYQHNLSSKNRYYIVLTISHSANESYDDVVGRLMKFKEKIGEAYRNSKNEKQKTKSFFHQFIGMAISIEVTYGKNGRHPHINILACSDTDLQIDKNLYDRNKYKKNKGSSMVDTLTNEALLNEWKKITGGSYIHNIRKINVINKHFSRSGIGEVFKYAIKFSSLGVKQLAEVLIAQKKYKYRFYETYGIFRKWDQGEGKEYEGERKDATLLYSKTNKQYEINTLDYSTDTEENNIEENKNLHNEALGDLSFDN